MKKILNKRLETLSAFINNEDVVLDVGCDHSLLGIYLYLNRGIKVIGSDINEKPLIGAKKNIIRYHLEDEIELRLGNGLETVSSDINTLVISGMGGLSIINILKNIKSYSNIGKLIISPNNDFSITRRDISKLGFYITREKIVKDSGKFYLISEYKLGNEKSDNLFGKLDLTNEIVKEYFLYLLESNKVILNKLGLNDTKKRESLIKINNKICKTFMNEE